jgi:hypothetical protein
MSPLVVAPPHNRSPSKFYRSINLYRTPGGGDKDKDGEEDKKMQDALSSAIVREKPNVKWTDVAGLDQAKSSL